MRIFLLLRGFLFAILVSGYLTAAAQTVSPSSVTAQEGATQQFTSGSGAVWTTNCGSISSTGLFKAPLYPKVCTITATGSGGSWSATASVNVVSPIVMTPVSATTPQGQTQQFTASASVTWTAACGTITSSGLYTASAAVGTYCTVEGIATTSPKYTVYGYDKIGKPVSTTLTISPLNPSIIEGATQQFTASAGATWAATCGTINSAGLYTAPLIPTSCGVTAAATDGSGHTASTLVTVTSPVSITPATATTAQGLSQQFTANMTATWSATCGTISSGGLYTASGSVGTNCTIEAIAVSTPQYTAFATDMTGSAPTLTISPLNPSATENATIQFTASAGATWSSNCGTINSTGLYSAPFSPGSCGVTATATDGSSHTASTLVTVTSPITISPATATTAQGLTQQFAANMTVTWSATCGTISSGGLYTASGNVGTNCTIEAIASSAPQYTAFATDTTASATFAISPANPTVLENANQQFTSASGATWTTNCGSISSTGLFKAPLYPKACTISSTSSDGTINASTGANVVSAITMTPVSATTPQGLTQQFTASAPVTWTAACGSITAGGLYTASANVGTYCTVEGIATTTPKYTVYGYDKIGPPILAITPLNSTLAEGTAEQFTATLGATWSASCGTISSAGLYTAPMQQTTCTVSATATNGSGQTASTTVSVAPAQVSPATRAMLALDTQQFSANMQATWTASCGSISSTGLFQAPTAAGPCSITATSTSNPGVTATANVAISVVNYTTFRGDNSRSGVQAQEYKLTPANVNASSFGPAWSMTLDSGIWSQPLFMNALTVNGAPHNVVFETTANDSVYAIDANNGSLLWQRSFLSLGVTAVAGSSIKSAMNPVGIVGTPVIDPNDNTMYVVAMTAENSNSAFIHRLHAIDITTGLELPNSPVVIAAPGFNDSQQMQRSALLLANGRVYVAFGSIGDRLPYQGFVFAYDTASLALDAVLADDPNYNASGGAGIWMSANGPAADADGYIYVTTGNGYFDGVQNFGQSVLKLTPELGLIDFFTPFDNVAQSDADVDLGSGGVLLIPDQTSGPYLHEMIVCGKPTPIYLINRNAMGEVGTGNDNILQRLDSQLGQTGNFPDSGMPCFSTPAFWNQNVYVVANHDVMKMFTLSPTSGLLTSSPVSQGTLNYAWPGAYPVISSNGNSSGIVWTYEIATGTLRATDTTNVSNEFYVGSVFAGAKWSVPTVIDGHVFIETQNKISAFANH